MSRSVLAERLRRLQRVGILERRAPKRGKWSEYRLTAAGHELQRLIDVLGEWGARWAFGDPRSDELDPIVLLWWMRRRVDFDRIPRRRVVLQFEFRGTIQRTYWLIIGPTDASVCLKNPRFEIDLIVSADIRSFYRVWLGRSTLAEALRQEQLQLDGTPADVRSFPHWFALSPMAGTIRAASAARRASRKLEGKSKRPQGPSARETQATDAVDPNGSLAAL
jgi:hypothetical protein